MGEERCWLIRNYTIRNDGNYTLCAFPMMWWAQKRRDGMLVHIHYVYVLWHCPFPPNYQSTKPLNIWRRFPHFHPSSLHRQLAALCTASELSRALGIDYHHFPRGVRACSPQFERYRMLRSSCPNERGVSSLKALKALIRERDSKRKMIRYIALIGYLHFLTMILTLNIFHWFSCTETSSESDSEWNDTWNAIAIWLWFCVSVPLRYQQVKCVLAGSGRNSKRKTVPENVLTVHLSEFYSKVRAALNDPEVELIPMVSIVSRRTYQRKEEDFRFIVLSLSLSLSFSIYIDVVAIDAIDSSTSFHLFVHSLCMSQSE